MKRKSCPKLPRPGRLAIIYETIYSALYREILKLNARPSVHLGYLVQLSEWLKNWT